MACKYYKQIKQRRYIEGGTWEDVTPAEYQKGELYEMDSTDCGYVPSNYLVFVPISGDTTFTFNSSTNKTVDYSLDSGTTWATLSSGGTTPTVSVGNKVYWRAEWGARSSSAENGKFLASNYFNVEGNIMSLASGDTVEERQFSRLFSGNTYIVNAENLSLPATTLAYNCYYSMFKGCTSLTTAPELPATTLANNCYNSMFRDCTSLTTAPELPSTTLATYCYSNMFSSCTSLTTAPALPATTLAGSCYYYMFNGCTSLTTAPELPATTLASNCYQQMFYGCTSLNSITCLATNISATNCTYYWLDGVASSGTFTKAASMSSWTTGTSGIPNGWTVQNAL